MLQAYDWFWPALYFQAFLETFRALQIFLGRVMVAPIFPATCLFWVSFPYFLPICNCKLAYMRISKNHTKNGNFFETALLLYLLLFCVLIFLYKKKLNSSPKLGLLFGAEIYCTVNIIIRKNLWAKCRKNIVDYVLSAAG
jgi:hypothetical protein